MKSLLHFFIFFIACISGSAQFSKLKPKRFGIVIGVSDYTQLPPLHFAHKDAETFYQFLLASQPDAEATERIFLMRNAEVFSDAVAQKLYEIDSAAGSGDEIYIFFAGHGDSENSGNGLLLLQNMPQKNYLAHSKEFLSMNLFSEFLNRWDNRNIKTIFIADACHSGSLIGGPEGKGSTLETLKRTWKNEIYMLACENNELSSESAKWGGGHGLFSYFLINGLLGMADNSRDSIVNLFELEKYVTDSVGQKSEMSQIPVLSGDKKTVLSRYSKSMLAAAKRISAKSNPFDNSIAFKGNDEGSILKTLKDSLSIRLFKRFSNYVKQDIIPDFEMDSAVAIYKRFPEASENRIAKGYMKVILINRLQDGFNTLIASVYHDQLNNFDFESKYRILDNLRTCTNLIGSNHYLFKQLRSKIMFIQASDASTGIVKGVPPTAALLGQLREAIDTLKEAIRYDPYAPYLYLQIGDYFLFSGSFEASVYSYKIYQQFLPNDEYAMNKLGFAYAQIKQYDLAKEMFVKALKTNPNFYQAQENLRVLMQKR